jgi:glutathione S-transferase
MADIILHHYWISPYAEKIRRILGFKRLAWRSVEIPIVAPKPDLIALTGGYRKTPVLQIGADIYCDTDCIVPVLERLQPQPTLFPPGTHGVGFMLGAWQQELFMAAVLLAGATTDVFPEGFVEDRATMFEGGFDVERIFSTLPARRDQLRAKLTIVEDQLAGSGPYLLGAAPCLGDFAILHPLFALRSLPGTAPLLDPFPAINDWLERMDAFGHGDLTPMSGGEAIAVARETTPATPTAADPDDPNGRRPGDRVNVVHESFGNDPVEGVLVRSSVHEIAIRRTDLRVGEVVVHFPREHYVVMPAD